MLRRASVDLGSGPQLRGACPALLRPVARFLAQHRALRQACNRVSRSEVWDAVVGMAAMAATALLRASPHGHQAMLESAPGRDPAPSPCISDDIEHEFLCGIMKRPATRARAADFLRDLRELSFGVQTGLVKTWFHAGLVRPMLRLADLLAEGESSYGAHPVDAIVAPFGQCNLNCRGCYVMADLGGVTTSPERLGYVVRQLADLHVYHIMLVGRGEPFFDSQSRWCLFDVVRRNPRVFFSVYTNGTTIEPADAAQLRRLPNLITLVSLDGPEVLNDARRGAGVYRRVMRTFTLLRDAGVVFGFITTVFRQNCAAALDERFVRTMAGQGCRLGYYSQFVTPPGAAGEPWSDMMLDAPAREQCARRFLELEATAAIPLIDIDGIEAHIGCRARRGGTVFVDAITGQVSPCIRTPIAAGGCNIYEPQGPGRLAEILRSEPFARYRQQRGPFVGCEAFAGRQCCSGGKGERG